MTAPAETDIPNPGPALRARPPRPLLKLQYPDGRVLFQANEGPQNEVLWRNETEVLYGGARGGGKTIAGIIWLLLGNFDLDPSEPLYSTYINDPNYTALVLRRNAADLKEWVEEAKRIFGPLGAKCSGNPTIIEFKSKARIYTNHLESDDAFEKYKGWNIWKILIEELTLIPKLGGYLKLLASLRAFNSGGKARPQIFSTTNPDGDGSAWVCNRFVEVPIIGGGMNPWGQRMKDPITGLSRIFMPAKVADNPYSKNDPNYMGMLLSQDKQTQDAWIHGLWHSMAGTFFREWRNQLSAGGARDGEPVWANHVIRPIPLKPWWFRWGGGDWGYKHHASFYKFCLSQQDGRIHVYDELDVQGVGSYELGQRLARWWAPDLDLLPDKQITIHMSPDAFDDRDARNSLAQQVQAGILSILGPGSSFLMKKTEEERALAKENPSAAEYMFAQRRADETGSACITLKRANHDRKAGAAFIRDLLRWRPGEVAAVPDLEYAKRLYEEKGMLAYTDYLGRFKKQKTEILPRVQFHQRQHEGGPGCPRVIRCMPMLQHAKPPKQEDVLKVDADDGQDGDDTYDGVRYGFMAARDIQVEMPKAYWVDEQMAEYRQQTDDPNALRMIYATQSARYDREYGNSEGGMTFARAGSSRHRMN